MSDAGRQRPRVKICGVTRPLDAERAVELGADLLGLNFWPGSPRQVGTAAGREIAAAVAGRAALVGVFVNEDRGRVEEIAAALGLDLLQFHGDEGPAELAPFASRALKALRFRGAPDPQALAGYETAWGFLVEARVAGAYGGVAAGWDYAAARALVGERLGARPLLIAGGLRPENVGRAIAAAGAWGVDVASGVESAPGIKDHARLEKFFEEVRHAAQ